MRLYTRFKRLNLWNKLFVFAAVCSIFTFVWQLWPEGSGGASMQIEAGEDAVVQAPVESPGAILQNMSNSPGGAQIAIEQVDRIDINSTLLPRRLSGESRARLATKLATLESMRVDMTVPIGDPEAQALGQQIKSVLLDAGWPVPQGTVRTIWETPILGCQIVFKSPPEEKAAAVFAEMLAALKEPKKLWINSGLREDTLQINVGAQRPHLPNSLE